MTYVINIQNVDNILNINNMVNKNGNKKYAYVTLVMLNNTYASPAIVLAESIRKLGSLADLIVFVDKNIDNDTIDLLKYFYDKVICVDLLKIEHKNKIQQFILTKLYALELINYEKIIMIDVDCIIFKNTDKVFFMNEPGLILINKTKTEQNNLEKLSSGLVLIKPNKKDFDKVFTLLKDEDIKNENKPLIYILKKIYKKLNTFDDTILSSNKYDEMSDGIQYNIDKPFLMSSDKPIEDRIKLDIFKVWFYYFANILNKYPEIRKYKCLQETIEVSKYFLSNIGRTIVLFRNKRNKIENVRNIYRVEKDKNLEFYHLNISKEYDNTDVNYMVNNLDLVNFVKYIKSMNSSFNFIYNTGSINDIISEIKDDDLLFYLLSEYIKLYTNVFAVLLIDNKKENVSSDLKNNLLYKKDFTIKGIILKNILFNINQEYVYSERINNLLFYEDNKEYKITLEIYQFLYPINFTKYNDTTKKIYVFNDTNSKIRLSSVFLNRNTFNKFNKKEITYFNRSLIDRDNLLKIMNFQTLKKFIYNTWDGENISNLIMINPNTILDTNKYKAGEVKKIIDKKIEIIDIIFANSSKYKKIISNINNPKYYYELEGIKHLYKKIDF